MTRVCVAGAGVIGSLFAAHLSRVAEVSALVRREEHAAALERDGLRVSGRADFTGRLAAATSPEALPEPELVIVACKSLDLDSVAARLAGHWPDAIVMTVQNGIGADEVDLPLRRLAPAHVRHLHERHATRGHARAVRARHRDLDRAGARHDARRCAGGGRADRRSPA